MKISIECTEKEIADLVLLAKGQQSTELEKRLDVIEAYILSERKETITTTN